MSSNIHATSAFRASATSAGPSVVPTSVCAARSAHAVTPMWTKQLPLAPDASGAVKVNRNKGAMGAPGFWDPV